MSFHLYILLLYLSLAFCCCEQAQHCGVWTTGSNDLILTFTVNKSTETRQLFWWVCRDDNAASKFISVAVFNDTYGSVHFDSATHTSTLTLSKESDFVKPANSGARFQFKVDFIGGNNAFKSWKIQVEDCNIKDSQVEVVPPLSELSSPGMFQCHNEQFLFDKRTREKASTNTTCGHCAHWRNAEFMECWEAPVVELSTREAENTYKANQKLPLDICSVTPGKPEDFNLSISWNGQFTPLSQTVLRPKHNNMTVFCQVENELTAKLQHREPFSKSRSEDFILTVQFAPILNFSSICVKSFEEEAYFVLFYSNPEVANNSLHFRLRANNTHNETIYGIATNTKMYPKYGTYLQNFTARLKLKPDDMLYLDSAEGFNPTFSIQLMVSSCFSYETTTQPVATTFTASTSNFTASTSTFTSSTSAVGGTVDNDLTEVDDWLKYLLIGIAVLLFLTTVYMCIKCRIWLKCRKKLELNKNAAQNPAFDESMVSGNQGSSERQECANVLYGTADDLKSGGNSSHQMVDNVLYGTTIGPQVQDDVYTTVNKTNKKKKGGSGSDQGAELYASVQKPKKTKGKAKGVDPGASTSGLQSDDTYAEVNKDRKNKKDGKKAGKGQENSGFAGDAQQDATYAVVDKKKNKGAKGKKADEPGTSGLVEEATYAVVNKKHKKPKKDGPDDDLHGSNKA